MARKEIKKLIEKSTKELQKRGVFPEFEIPEIKIEKSEEKIRGDYATNIAMVISRILKKNPIEIAEKLKHAIQYAKYPGLKKVQRGAGGMLDTVEVANPGFINFFLSKEYLQKQIEEILKQKEKYGAVKIGKRKKINVEFISANPTGPLTLGNGRGGFCGDVLANILAKAGFNAKREYYINNVGEQIKKLGHSVIGDSEAVYKGSYIDGLRMRLIGASAEEAERIGEKAAKIILEKMIKPSVKKMGISFNVWFSEKRLHRKKEVDKTLYLLKKNGLAYEKENALWFKSTQFGDDKDRVLIKANGEKTYITSDIAYLRNKFKRGFDKLIYIWGADHYGYVARIKAAAEVFGFDKEKIKIIIMQMVRLFESGKEIRMSKRAGVYIALDELIDEVGLDVARFFFLTKAADSHLNFNLDLAREQSEKNPVYYVQYAYARICSILKKETKCKMQKVRYEMLNHSSELELIRQLIRLPEIVEDTAKDYQVQRLPRYAMDLSAAFHQFYRDCKVLTEARPLRKARIGLILATKIVLKNILDLMGVSAPTKM